MNLGASVTGLLTLAETSTWDKVGTVVATAATVVLAVLTGIYVVLTRSLVATTAKGNEESRRAFEQQSLITTLPHLSLRGEIEDGTAVLRLLNAGDMPATDVDLVVLASYSVEDYDVEQFVATYARKDEAEKALSALVRIDELDGDFFGVSDHLVYDLLEPHTQVIAPLFLPGPPEYLNVLLQFRDVVGRNFARVVWLYRDREVSAYRVGAISPEAVLPHERVEFEHLYAYREGNVKGIAEAMMRPDGTQIPLASWLEDELDRNFGVTWVAGISAGQLAGVAYDVEDRGRREPT